MKESMLLGELKYLKEAYNQVLENQKVIEKFWINLRNEVIVNHLRGEALETVLCGKSELIGGVKKEKVEDCFKKLVEGYNKKLEEVNSRKEVAPSKPD